MASLDYYHGQVLTEIVEGDEDWQWALRFDGGAIVKNWDKRRTAVPEIPVGSGFLMSIFEIDSTQIVLGSVDPATQTVMETGRVTLTPTQYSITDPVHAVEEEFPQAQLGEVVADENALYPEHLLAREATGPENKEDEIVQETSNEAVSGESADDEDDEGEG